MTEEEAKTKWCPMVRIDGSNMSMNIDDGKADLLPTCVGSDCMMWRPLRGKFGYSGYCGLAGKL